MTVVSHEGATDQYSAALRWLPDQRIGVIALTNTGRSPVLAALTNEVTLQITRRLNAASGRKRLIVR
jgi:fructoselysine-6-P-deglycase FrlB-like protein